MPNKSLLLSCLFSAFCLMLFAAEPISNYKGGLNKKGNEISFQTTTGKWLIQVCTPDMFRIRFRASGNFDLPEKWMVVNYNWNETGIKIAETKTQLTIKTSKLQMVVNKQPFKISVLDQNGKLLSSDATSKVKNANESKNANEIKNATEIKNDTITVTKTMQTDEHVFGFGERMDFIDQRSKNIKLNVGRGKGLPHIIGAYNVLDANYCPVPFFMSTKGYAIFLHSATATSWDMGSTESNTYTMSSGGKELEYYFIYGPDFPHMLDLYTNLTGKSPMLPDYAMGLHIGTYAGGTWGFEQLTSDAYVLALAKKLRDMEVPVDILHLDSVWRIFGKIGGKGATSFEWRETFTNPKRMFDSLYAMKYKMVGLHVRPRFDNGNKLLLLDTARLLHFTYPEKNSPGEFVNFFDTAAVEWWWKHGVKRVADLGAKFLKTDEGSAFGDLANESDKMGPTGAEVKTLHNLFPIAYAKGAYESFQKYNGIRGMNHTREGYAGIQRYPFLFAGDWPSEWQYFAPVIKAGLNIGLSGVSNWANCMGGFEHPADPELFIRWTQFGLLSPIALLFGMDHPGYKEPWSYGDEAFAIFKKYDSLRYRLFPYLYHASYQSHKTGMPMMRALVLQYQDDENVYSISDQYMLGNDLMVCPVTTKGAVTRTVYLPKGEWFNYWTGEKWTGKKYIHVLTPLDEVPIFVRSGAIIPMHPAMKYFREKPVDVITLDVYPGNAKGALLYEDDGISLDYAKGKSTQTDYEIKASTKEINILVSVVKKEYKVSTHTYDVSVHLNVKPSQVMVNGQDIKSDFNPVTKLLLIKTEQASTPLKYNISIKL